MNSRTPHRWLALGLLLAVLILPQAEPRAHSPIFNDAGSPTLADAFEIEEIEVSKAVMGAIRKAKSVDYYRFEVPDGEVLSISLFVLLACEGFYPQISLIGRDAQLNASSIPLDVPVGLTPREFRLPAEEWGTYFEPFDPAFYHAGPKFSIRGRGETQFLAVYSAEKTVGAYMLGTSGAERWQPAENWRERKAAYDQCEVGQANWFLGNWRAILFGFATVGAVTITGSYFLHRTKKKSDPSSNNRNL